jgi:shikimate kinase
MGAGKSTVGAELARRLGWQFRDLDDLIAQREKLSVEEIFVERGEGAFREMENAALSSLGESSAPMVLALGGGAFAQASNRGELKRMNARTIFLSAPLAELWRRCTVLDREKVRPLLADRQRFDQLYDERLPAYQKADITIETLGKDVAQIAAEIERLNLAWH